MYGTIVFYWPDAAGEPQRGMGILRDWEDNTYLFHESALPPDFTPQLGDQVEFEAAQVMGCNVATQVRPLQR